LILPSQPLDDGIVALRLIDERDLRVIERASRDPEIAGRFGLSRPTAGEYLKAYAQGWSDGIAAAIAVTERPYRAWSSPIGGTRVPTRRLGYWLMAEARGEDHRVA
jgi:hypothetical protein